MEFEGVKGNVTANGYKDHIAIDSATFNARRDISMVALFKEFMGGSAGKKATIKFVHTGSDKVQEFMSLTLENCLIGGYSMSGSGESHPTLTFQLSFSKILLNYNDLDAANKSSGPQRAGYDLSAAKLL